MAVDDIFIDVSGCVSTNDSTNASKMLISGIAVSQQNKGKTLANTRTLDYNRKVNQGKDESKLPDLIYSNSIVMSSKLLTWGEVSEWIGASPSTIRRMVKSRKFPSPYTFGKRCVRFNAWEVQCWMDALTNN